MISARLMMRQLELEHSNYEQMESLVGRQIRVDNFANPSGRGTQAEAHHSVANPPFGHTIVGFKVVAFPPLAFVESFLTDAPKWRASSISAVLPTNTMHAFNGSATLLQAYGSHFGIFERHSGSKSILCAPIGCTMGAYLLNLRIQLTHTYSLLHLTIHIPHRLMDFANVGRASSRQETGKAWPYRNGQRHKE